MRSDPTSRTSVGLGLRSDPTSGTGVGLGLTSDPTSGTGVGPQAAPPAHTHSPSFRQFNRTNPGQGVKAAGNHLAVGDGEQGVANVGTAADGIVAVVDEVRVLTGCGSSWVGMSHATAQDNTVIGNGQDDEALEFGLAVFEAAVGGRLG